MAGGAGMVRQRNTAARGKGAWAAVLLTAGWLACRGQSATPPPDLPAVAGQASLLRFPSAGGPVQSYRPDSLAAAGWTTYPVPPIRRVLGADLDERLLWALDARDSLLAIDLETRTARRRLGHVVEGTVGPDGSLYLADRSGRIVRMARRKATAFHDSLPAQVQSLFAAINDQVVAVIGPPLRLITANLDQVVHSTALPAGNVAATPWGDLVGVAGDSGVTLYEIGAPREERSLPVEHARRITFSPSGHRLFVSQEEDRVRVFDRFTLREMPAIDLPGQPREFRVDASGRWLLVHREAGDSVWVVDLATNHLAASVLADWNPDLPLVAGPSTLVVRQGEDVVALDLRQLPVRETGRLREGGRDLWLAVSWVPPERLPAALAAADSARVVQDSALATGVAPSPSDSSQVYLQISRTQNPDWANLLVKQLLADGFPALVLDPVEPEDGYRVVVGPYQSRESADSIGRALGRAYFILRLPPKPQ